MTSLYHLRIPFLIALLVLAIVCTLLTLRRTPQ
jgi:hypothetical protein